MVARSQNWKQPESMHRSLAWDASQGFWFLCKRQVKAPHYTLIWIGERAPDLRINRHGPYHCPVIRVVLGWSFNLSKQQFFICKMWMPSSQIGYRVLNNIIIWKHLAPFSTCKALNKQNPPTEWFMTVPWFLLGSICPKVNLSKSHEGTDWITHSSQIPAG